MAPTATSPPPSRWTLRTIRATFDAVSGLTLGGVWRAWKGCRIRLRTGLVQHYRPDPEYVGKRDYLYKCMSDAAREPGEVEWVFLDEMGYSRWPDPAADWAGSAPLPPPLADRADSPTRLWRIIGARNAGTGRVDFLDASLVGRAKVIPFSGQLDRADPDARRLLVVQDNGSIPSQEDVLAALPQWPRI